MKKNLESDLDEKKDSGSITSSIIEKSLFNSRSILITGEINQIQAQNVTAKLLALSCESDDPINVFVCSPGGHVESGDMIHDMINFISPEVRTIGSGWVASAGALIFISARKENRYCLPNTRFLIHQPSGGVSGQAGDIEIQAKQIKIMKERLELIFSDATGQPVQRIQEDTKRDFWLTTEEALEYGLVGKVISSQKELDQFK